MLKAVWKAFVDGLIDYDKKMASSKKKQTNKQMQDYSTKPIS